MADPAPIPATVQDVIQLDPASCEWGPLLAIVDEVKSWGVQCYAVHAEKRGEPPSAMFMRVKHGAYVVIGRAAWVMGQKPDEGDGDADPG